MLGFFRKYQRFFFIIITFVIVISFSFFGTYTGMPGPRVVDKPVFQAINGSEIYRSELEAMAMFIGTDNDDKLLMGGRWGPNFLNDGVIKKDFLETGLAAALAEPFLEDLKTDLQTRHQREKHYRPYQHPQAKFINAENAWNIVAPDLNRRFTEMRQLENPASKEGFDARVNLFLAERRFPHPALKMVLGHQQKQYKWVQQDPNLNYLDLALFGYHTTDDWFGSRFTRLVSEFIINSAIIAREKGYEISQNEVLADLYRQAEISFQQNASNPNLGVANAKQYFNEQLRRMGMDVNQAAAVWQQVMLFRRLFHDLGNSVFVDPYTIEQFQSFAKQSVEGNLFQLPKGLRLADFKDLQKFEVYLSAVSERPVSGMEMLEMPETYKSIEQIAEETPELAERRYLVEIAQVNSRDLQVKVGVKEAWGWQAQDSGWEKLKQKFPELGIKNGTTEKERDAALESLDAKTRNRVDAFSREQIVKEHEEWLSQSLKEAEGEEQVIAIRKKGKSSVIAGLSDAEPLIALLDRYPETRSELEQFTADGQTYYRIEVKESTPGYEVMTFEEARKDGTLEGLVSARLQSFYSKTREKDPKKYQKEDGSWKPFEQVQDLVAQAYFANVLQAINQYYTAVVPPDQRTNDMIADYAATVRLYAFMRGLREQFQADSDAVSDWVISKENASQDVALEDRGALNSQWKVDKVFFHGDRSTKNLPMNEEEVYRMSPGGWTSVKKQPNGNLSFFQLEAKKEGEDREGVLEKVMIAQKLFSNDAQEIYMQKLVDRLISHHALSLQYMNPMEETEE
jgi:GcvH upstream region-like protein